VRDVARVETGGHDLVQQRLERVVVVAVDDDDVDGRVGEVLDEVDAGESGTDDDDPVPTRGGQGRSGMSMST